jgi:hypothetical protein
MVSSYNNLYAPAIQSGLQKELHKKIPDLNNLKSLRKTAAFGTGRQYFTE